MNARFPANIFLILSAIIIMAIAPSITRADPAVPTKLIGLDAINAILGNTLITNSDDGLMAVFFATDHSVKRKKESEVENFTWAIHDDKLCIASAKNSHEDCTSFEVTNDDVLVKVGSDIVAKGILLRGNRLNL
jgi:hypothetical protein